MPTTETSVTLSAAVSDVRAFIDAIEAIENTEGEEEKREEALQAFAAAVTVAASKVDSFSQFVLQAESRAEFLRGEAARSGALAKTLESLVDRLREYAVVTMRNNGATKLEGSKHEMKLKRCPPSVGIFDEAAIPPRYITIKETLAIDKRQLLADLKKGADIPGALLIEDKQTLSIR